MVTFSSVAKKQHLQKSLWENCLMSKNWGSQNECPTLLGQTQCTRDDPLCAGSKVITIKDKHNAQDKSHCMQDQRSSSPEYCRTARQVPLHAGSKVIITEIQIGQQDKSHCVQGQGSSRNYCLSFHDQPINLFPFSCYNQRAWKPRPNG